MSNRVAVGIIIGLMMLFQCNLAIFLPAFSAIAQSLHASVSAVQMLPSCFMLGFGISGFIYGVLADIYGRRRMQLIGLAIYLIGCSAACFAGSISVLLIALFLQGAGIGSQDVIGRAILCDLFDECGFANAASTVSMVAPIMPMFAPIIGGYLTQYGHWRMVFVVLLMLGLLCFGLVFLLLTETKADLIRVKHKNIKAFLTHTFINIRFVFSNKVFFGFFSAGIAAGFGNILFSVMSPYILQQNLNMSPVHYSWAVATISVGLILGAWLAKFLNRKKTIIWQVKLGLGILLLSAAIMSMSILFYKLTVVMIIVPMIIYQAGAGIIVPNANAGALSPFAKMAGLAGAVQGGTQYIILSLLSSFFIAITLPAQFVFAMGLFLISLLATLLFTRFV